MWICQRCGEPHQDQFKDCWKCIGAETAELETPELAPPVPTTPERPLRSLRSILLRALIGFGIGTLLSMVLTHRSGVSLMTATNLALCFGAVTGLLVGVFVWVVFPFEP